MSQLGDVPVGGPNPVRIMGVINISPESFFKKSVKTRKKEITETVETMEEQGADFIDIGGMSTAPYLTTVVPEKVEADRITKAVKIVQGTSNLPISVDTCRAKVAKTALELGVDIINDISGLKHDDQMSRIVEKYSPSLVLCAFSKKLVKGNQLIQTKKLLQESVEIAKSANVPKEKISLDPAIGFFRKSGRGKFFTKINSDWLERDLVILQKLEFLKFGFPLMISVSNKSFIGRLLNLENPHDRLYGSLAAEVISVYNGADIIRTHNVKETREAITVAKKLSNHIRKGL
ncbi:MAG: dihydropteroate synthase [Nitrosopumilaceae archaeon]